MLLIVDIHFNAGGGQGFEVYYSRVGGTSKTLGISTAASPAKPILDKTGYKKGDKTIVVLSLKELLLNYF